MKETKKLEGIYCPKRPGYRWAHLPPKKERDGKASRPQSGGPAAKETEE